MSFASSKSPLSQGDQYPEALLAQAVQQCAFGVTIADARRADMPLVHSNRAFEKLSGYSTAETYGRNCRFLQGPETDRHSVEMIRDTIRAEKAATVLILNYRKDGSRFWNRLQLSPLHDSKGRLEA